MHCCERSRTRTRVVNAHGVYPWRDLTAQQGRSEPERERAGERRGAQISAEEQLSSE
jgi:hypothetical protein